MIIPRSLPAQLAGVLRAASHQAGVRIFPAMSLMCSPFVYRAPVNLRAAARCSSTGARLSGIQRLPWPRIWARIAAVKAVIFYPLLYAYARMPFRELVGEVG